jgi:hypothetical protein
MPPTKGQVYKFLKDAAEDDDFRKKLSEDSASSLKSYLQKEYRYPGAAIPGAPRTIPSKEACWALLAAARLEYGTYNQSAEAPPSLQSFMMVEGHAMPLVVTVEDERAAAG